MLDKLKAAERTFKELQLRMSDPEVAADAAEFQKVMCEGHWRYCVCVLYCRAPYLSMKYMV